MRSHQVVPKILQIMK